MSRPLVPAAKTLLLGTHAPFSAAVFRGLVTAGVDVVAVAVDGHHEAASILTVSVQGHRETLPSLAIGQGLSVRAVPDARDPDFAAWIGEFKPDFILVACFDQWLPGAVREIPRLDCLNIHPSRLPRYRGPAPLFWQLRDGAREAGVTLHRVGDEFDAGPVVASDSVRIEDGLDGIALAECCAATGCRLFVDRVADYRSGTVVADPQDESRAERQAAPRSGDFMIPTAWSARRAYNFMRGTQHWGRAYPLAIEGREFALREALAWTPGDDLGAGYAIDGDAIRVRCTPGTLHATLA